MRHTIASPRRVHTGGLRVGAAPMALVAMLCIISCTPSAAPPEQQRGRAVHPTAVQPVVVTEPVTTDSDDPAIWIHPDDPSQSLVLGTDKGGAVFVFDLDGKILPDKTVSGQGRINNIDVEYGMMLGGVADRHRGRHRP